MYDAREISLATLAVHASHGIKAARHEKDFKHAQPKQTAIHADTQHANTHAKVGWARCVQMRAIPVCTDTAYDNETMH